MEHGLPEEPSNRYGDTHSELSGSAANVVQSHQVSGGVHFHSAAPVRPGSVPRQLPADVRGFVNRRADLARLDTLMAQRDQSPTLALCMITGTAGVGKTSLALHWAHRARERFPDGQLYVNLRGYDPRAPLGPGEALERFLRALDVPATSIPSDLEDRSAQFRSQVAKRRLLIVLDNAATVGQIRPLLPGAAECVVLVTSRNRLAGLMVRDGAHRLDLETLASDEAVALVRDTTENYRPTDDPGELAELARLCVGLPLALRIAAERAASRPYLRLSDLIADLRSESSLWDALSTDEDSDSVRTVFAWSYRALDPEAARLFRLLGLHPGDDFTVESAAALAAHPVRETRHLLDVLAGAHLLEQKVPGRYQFHDLLRAYSTGQAHHDETPDDRHAALAHVLDWYLHTATAAASTQNITEVMDVGPLPEGVTPLSFADHAEALRWYRDEQGNLLDVARVARDIGRGDVSWKIFAVLHALQVDRSPFDDWFALGDIALTEVRAQGDRVGEALILMALGTAHNKANRTGAAIGLLQTALTIYRDTGMRSREAESINSLGLTFLRRRDLDGARSQFSRLREVADASSHPGWKAFAAANLASTYIELDEPQKAIDSASEALVLGGGVGLDPVARFDPLLDLSRAHRVLGRCEEALGFTEQARAIADELDNPVLQGAALLELGLVQRAYGRNSDALATYQRCAAIHREIGDRNREAQAMGATGETYQELGRPEQAADFHRIAVMAQRDLGNRWFLALALNNLATALDQTGAADQARHQRREAMAALTGFTDPKAVKLRETLVRRVGHPEGESGNGPHHPGSERKSV
ncbi:ATP-binding protein [Nocardiopsis mangrovi]|uniref:ATP-binding protein n=1 Tax=Nocardiopsis mangrovi TaxID=1179818 RepID=A0ABV9DXF0_9ACTN